jgi:hypothetical protein
MLCCQADVLVPTLGDINAQLPFCKLLDGAVHAGRLCADKHGIVRQQAAALHAQQSAKAFS